MADAARARAAPLHRGLPDEILIWEILVRLPPKSLLRCRAVCRGWRAATSTRDFLLAHHGHQPALPLLHEYNHSPSINIIPLDHRAGVAAADKLHPVARLGYGEPFTNMHLEASCDGLLILATEGESCTLHFSVCNPATRQHAPLPLLRGFGLAGMYPHPPTGEYRLLVYPDLWASDDERPPGAQDACYLYALGSCQPPRHIGWPEVEMLIHAIVPVLFRGSLHWHIEGDESEGDMIVVFDTTTELFWQMHAPAVPGGSGLFDMDGVLGMATFSGGVTAIDIWMMQDYDSEVWAFQYRVKLPVAELTVRSGFCKYAPDVAVLSSDDDVIILVQSDHWLLQIDVAGKLVSSFNRKLLSVTQFRLKQTLVQHTFFPTMEGYVVNTWPFISLDDSVVKTLRLPSEGCSL